MTRSAVAILVALASTSGFAAGGCPPYAAQEWEFTGHLVNRVYPGPPDYESISGGDAPVTRWYLQLSWPACFAEFKHVLRFQLAPTPEDVEKYRELLGKRITVRGRLAQAAPDAYSTPLVFDVTSL